MSRWVPSLFFHTYGMSKFPSSIRIDEPFTMNFQIEPWGTGLDTNDFSMHGDQWLQVLHFPLWKEQLFISNLQKESFP